MVPKIDKVLDSWRSRQLGKYAREIPASDPDWADLGQSSTELATASRSNWLPNGSSGVTRKLLRNRSYFVVISLVYLTYGIQRGPRMVHDGVIMTAAVDAMRLPVGDDLGEFERKNLAFFLLWTASKIPRSVI